MAEDNNWSPPHSHEPNPAPPSANPAFTLKGQGREQRLTPDDLRVLPQRVIADCLIISTGHGTSGPFTFGGVPLVELLDHYVNGLWATVDVISADGFRTRLTAAELRAAERPVLLALMINDRPMSRDEGLVRLIVPSETDDALKQVKWVGEIRVME